MTFYINVLIKIQKLDADSDPDNLERSFRMGEHTTSTTEKKTRKKIVNAQPEGLQEMPSEAAEIPAENTAAGIPAETDGK